MTAPRRNPDAYRPNSPLQGMSLARYATEHGVTARYHGNTRTVIATQPGANLTPVVEAWKRDVTDHKTYLSNSLKGRFA